MKFADLHSLFEAPPGVLTPGEVSRLIRASESYLYRLIAEERLPCFRIGVHYRILKRDVVRCLEEETYIDRHTHPPP